MSGIERPVLGLSSKGIKFGIAEGELELYQQAAAETGYRLDITGRAGDIVEFVRIKIGSNINYNIGEGLEIETHQVTLPPGRLQIQVVRPEGQRNHQAFWDAQRQLKSAPQPPQPRP